MKILVTGSSGLIGQALVPFLLGQGHQVVCLVRRAVSDEVHEIFWDPSKGALNPKSIEGFNAVIHLAGENIAVGRWNEEKKKRIRDSRVQSTQLLAETLASLQNPPSVFVTASAIGYYGNRGQEILHDESEPGIGFLSEVCKEWEEAAGLARKNGVRVVPIRLGIVLSPKGGALSEMLPFFKRGLGAILGNGRQYLGWIHIQDVVSAIEHILTHPAILRGSTILTAPIAVTQREFAKTLGKILHRPVFLRAPSFALKLMMGEMAQELILVSQRAEPARLIATGYQFQHPQLEGSLRDLT